MASVFPSLDESAPSDEEIDRFLEENPEALAGDLEGLPFARELFSSNVVPFVSTTLDELVGAPEKELKFAMNRKNENDSFDDETNSELDRQRKNILQQARDDQSET
ncbi:MAG: hypothetical protein CML13_06705 [Puniceicoccaceae bacterium]|nr:hypothetical protein [Puniceicoccaceae bacterium]